MIASLWPLDDTVAANAARAFYQHLATMPAAHALHEVIRELRGVHRTGPISGRP